MRRLACGIVFALVLSCQAFAQDGDVRHWPLREINFPIPLDRLNNQAQRPTKLRFFVNDRSGWKKVDERTPNELELIDVEKQRRGFRYTSQVDGAYDFALQLEYADGTVQPREADLSPQYRIVFDTRPPLVRVARKGQSTIEWDVTDEYLAATDGLTLEGRWVGEAKFIALKPRGFSPKARDSYSWNNLKPGEQLEVRIVARDKAGHETPSIPITVPGAGDGPGLQPMTNPAPGNTSFGQPNPDGYNAGYPGQPQLEYAKSWDLTISSTLHKVTRSGVDKAHLFMKEPNGNWTFVKVEPRRIEPTASKPQIEMKHIVKADGRYGFIVIPESGAGYKDDNPTPNQLPQYLIEVDTTKPVVEVLSVKPYGTGTLGPRVEITWAARDKNLTSTPIRIEWADTLTGPIWNPVTAERLANTGRHVWEIDNKDLWKFAIRITADDLALNEQSTIYKDLVKIDLETPKATIDKVKGGLGGPDSQSKYEAPPEPGPLPVSLPATTPAPTPIFPATKPIELTKPATPAQPAIPPTPEQAAPVMPKLPAAGPVAPVLPVGKSP